MCGVHNPKVAISQNVDVRVCSNECAHVRMQISGWVCMSMWLSSVCTRAEQGKRISIGYGRGESIGMGGCMFWHICENVSVRVCGVCMSGYKCMCERGHGCV